MTEHSVIDANCWCSFVDENLKGDAGTASSVFGLAQSIGSILFDNGQLIRQQYVQARRGFGEALFDDFFEKGVLSGTVRLVAAKADRQLGQTLAQLGVPRKEHVYFRAAASGGAAHIVSEDIDFFDPTLKRSGEDQKTAAKRNQSGCVCKEFRRAHGILIHCMEGFVAEAEQRKADAEAAAAAVANDP